MNKLAVALVAAALAVQGSAAEWQYWYGRGDGVSLDHTDNWNMKLDGTGKDGSPLSADTILGFINLGPLSLSLANDASINSIVVSGDSHVKLTVEPGKVLNCNGKNVNIGYYSSNYLDESYPPNGSKDDGFNPDARPSLEFVGVVSNAFPRVGSNPDLNGAEMTVSGAGSILHVPNNSLLVGINRGGSAVTVRDGATLVCEKTLEVGGGKLGSVDQLDAHNNVLTVTDSTLEIPLGMDVGNKTTNNLAVLKNATVTVLSGSGDGYSSSVGAVSSAPYNRLVLDGTVWGGPKAARRQKFHIGKGGSDGNALVLTNGARMYVSALNCGYSGSSNRLEVTGGSYLWANSKMILSADKGCGWNSADVAGEGTVLSNTVSSVLLGRNGSHNTLTVRDGATWFNERSLYLGCADGTTQAEGVGCTNLVEISGEGTTAVVSNAIFTANIDQVVRVKDGAKLTVTLDNTSAQSGAGQGTVIGTGDSTSISNRIEVLDGAEFTLTAKGSLTLGDKASASGCGLVADNATVTLGQMTYVGNYASGCFLDVLNGTTCRFTHLYLGNRVDSSNNTVRIAGAGTTMFNTRNTHNVFVGYAGKNSKLIVEDGAELSLSNNLCIARNCPVTSTPSTSSTADGSEVIVRNGGSLHVMGSAAYDAGNGNGIFVSSDYSKTSTPDVRPQDVRLVVDGGEVVTDQAIITQRDAEILVRGSANTIRAAQLRFADTAKLTFESDRNGFSTIQIDKTAGLKTAKCNFATDGTYITVDATKFAFAGGGTQTLIESEADISIGYEKSVENGKIKLIPEGTTLTLSADRKKLMVTVPNKKGLCIILR